MGCISGSTQWYRRSRDGWYWRVCCQGCRNWGSANLHGSLYCPWPAEPERTVTSKGFGERLVKGIIEDDLPYSLGEKSGMSKLFDYLLPCGISTPSHQTVQRDLDILYDKLDVELNQRLMVHTLSVLYYTQVNCVCCSHKFGNPVK
jgi:hypothetical protein